MDALAIGAEISGILGGLALVIGLTVWVWRGREQTQKAIGNLDARMMALQHAVHESIDERRASEGRINDYWNRLSNHVTEVELEMKRLQDRVVALEVRAATSEEFDTVARPALIDLQSDALKYQAAQVRIETEQQQALEKLRGEVAQLRERFEKIAGGYFPRP